MLGKSMAYTCGYWLRATDLDTAQQAKFDLICRKLGLHAGMTVLDIGYRLRLYQFKGAGSPFRRRNGLSEKLP